MQSSRRGPRWEAGIGRRSADRRMLRQIVKVWIAIQREGVLLKRSNKYKKLGRVEIPSQCTGNSSADANAQIYYYQRIVLGVGDHDKFLAYAVDIAVYV